jgi:hypothetical protein
LLRARVKRPDAPDAATLKKLFAELDSNDFRTREKATLALARFGGVIRAALLAERKRTSSAEVRLRLRRLLERLNTVTPERLRCIRAVEVVEAMDAPQARTLLQSWAGWPSGTTLATEAGAVLTRRR